MTRVVLPPQGFITQKKSSIFTFDIFLDSPSSRRFLSFSSFRGGKRGETEAWVEDFQSNHAKQQTRFAFRVLIDAFCQELKKRRKTVSITICLRRRAASAHQSCSTGESQTQLGRIL